MPPVCRVINIRYAGGVFILLDFLFCVDNKIHHCTPPDTPVTGFVVSSDILSVHSVINYLRSYKFSFTRVFQNRPMTCSQERKGFRQWENVKEIIYVLSIELLRFGHCYDALHMERDNGLNVHSTRKQIKCRCMGEQIRSMQ